MAQLECYGCNTKMYDEKARLIAWDNVVELEFFRDFLNKQQNDILTTATRSSIRSEK